MQSEVPQTVKTGIMYDPVSYAVDCEMQHASQRRIYTRFVH